MTSYSNLWEVLEEAAETFETLPLTDWAGWIVYLLEALDATAGAGQGDFDAVLERVERAIATRRAGGGW